MRLYTLLKAIIAKITTQKDYIVEQGTSGIWTYEKWASGKAVCWCNTTKSVSCTTSMFGGYGAINGIGLVLPFSFSSIKYVNVTGTAETVVGDIIHVWGNTGAVYGTPLVAYSATRTFIVRALAVGTWK